MCHTLFLTDYFLFTHFLNSFYPIIFSTFYSLFHSILQFISQHVTCLYLNILSVYFASILLVYSSIFNLLNLNFFFIYQHFICLFFNFSLSFLRFTRLLNLRSFVVSDKISAERYFKISHFLFWMDNFRFFLFYLYYFVFFTFYYFYLLIFY